MEELLIEGVRLRSRDHPPRCITVSADMPAGEVPSAWPKGSTWLLEGVEGRLSLAGYLPLADALKPPASAT